MTKPKQIVMHCPCGRPKVLARGLCPTCYTLKRQDEAYFGGHREEVLKRDDYRCRVPGCTTIKRGKRSVAVHHRDPGNSDPAKMLTLCLPCHAKVSRTLYVQDDWPEFLRVLWREQHPDGHEQGALNFVTLMPMASAVPLFNDLEVMTTRKRIRKDRGHQCIYVPSAIVCSYDELRRYFALKVSIKSLEVDMEIKNKGVELEIYEPDGTTRLGDLVITKTDLIWCPGRTRRENGIKIKWPAFVEIIQNQGKAPKKVAGKKAAAKKAAPPVE